jgi:predicted MFS family arabinose efflux permease
MFREVIRVRPIRRLVFAYGINQLGDWAAELALAVAVFTATGSAAGVAAVWVAHRAVLAWFSPLLAARLECRPRGRLLVALYLSQAGLFLLLVVTLPLGLVAVLPFVILDGLIAPTARALARSALVSVATPRGLLREANAVVNVVFTVNGVAANALGGVLVAVVGPRAALTVDVLSFLAAAVAVRRIAAPTASRNSSGRSRLREALRFARARDVIGGLLVADAVYTVFVASIAPIEVVFITGTLGAGPDAFGAVLTVWGLGMVAGGAAAARVRAVPVSMLLALAALATALACVGMGTSSSLGLVLGWAVVGGLGNGVYGMSFVTTMQERTPAKHQTCINALYELVGSVAPGAGFLIGGIVAAACSPRVVYIVAGLGGAAVVVCTVAALRTADWSPAPVVTASDH